MRERQRTGTGGGSLETQAPFSSAAFKLPLVNTLAPVGGYGPATFTRSTTATFFDNEGMLKEVRAGEARFTGARRVANLVTSSENLLDSSWLLFNGITATKDTLTFVNANSYLRLSMNTINKKGIFRVSLTMYGTPCSVGIEMVDSTDGSDSVITTAAVTNTPQTFTLLVDWSASSTVTTPAFFINRLGTITVVGAVLTVTNIQIEDVTGQADQTASEYVHSGRDNPNYLTYTDDFDSSAWINTNITITKNAIANPIDGRVNATKVEASATASGTACRATTQGIAVSTGMTACIYAKKGSGANHANIFNLYNLTSGSTIIYASLNYDTGFVTGVGATATDLGNGWWFVVLSSATGFSTGDVVRLFVGYPSISANAGEHAYFYGPTIMRGVVATPSYTPVGAAYDPHGSGVDGVKYFNTNKDLTSISPSVLKGYLTEGARTNNLLYSRDLTNAAWVKSTMTTALTATGIDGQANAASVLTATAGNATCLQPRTLASAVRSFSAFVRRKTGTGTISITRDGGTTWTDITLLLNTASYVRVSIENSTVLNPSCGFRITTSADAIEVDYCQDEAGYVFSNPILTTTATATRNQDFLSYPVAGNVDGATGSASASWGVNTPITTIAETQIAISRGTGGRFLYHSIGFISGRVSTYDSTNLTASVGLTRNTPMVARAAVGWSGSTMSLIAEGAASVSSTAFDGSFGTELSIYIGGIGTATWALYGNVKNVYIWSGRLTDTQLKQAVNA